jgi:hypothetical protein
LTLLLLQVYPERRTESILLSANMLEEESNSVSAEPIDAVLLSYDVASNST